MRNTIAIRKENIDLTERRSPLNPAQIKRLSVDYAINVIVEPWPNRFYSDLKFKENGAVLSSDIKKANVIFGVKEIPVDDLPLGGACVFFSHTIKGQPHNMPVLKSILEKKITLMDYEKVIDNAGKRLIFFGPYAGLAGAINSLWLLGKRLDHEQIKNPFSAIKQAKEYSSLQNAKNAVHNAAKLIEQEGLVDTGKPWVIVITGNGTVSRGAQEIIDLLPVTQITPAEFLNLIQTKSFKFNILYKVVIDCDNFVKPADPAKGFEWNDYFQNPQNYQSDFKKYLTDITVLINAIFWDKMYPKLISKDDLKELYMGDSQPDLRIIADISCDFEGSIECNMKSTSSDNPAYVYNPFDKNIKDGYTGTGPVILAVDKLPSELPAESTTFFGESLLPYIPALAKADFSKSFNDLNLPDEFKKAVIAHKGELTPDFVYLYDHL